MTPGAPGGLRATVVKRLARYTLDVSLHCEPGELLALVGPSGAGKTTVLRCLAGLDAPDAGEIHCNGETWSVGRRLLRKPQARCVGLLSQDALLFPHMTVLRNVEFAMERGDDALSYLAALGVAHLRNSKPHAISGGERQRVALCQVLARRPRLLLLDEPFSALDVENRLALRARLLAVRDEQRLPIIHVTHDLEDAVTMADRVISLHDGREDPGWLERQLDLLERNAGMAGRRLGSSSPHHRAAGAA